MITLVTGGSGSGKSAYAESLLYSCEGIRYYIATMQIYDAEGEKKVERHRKLHLSVTCKKYVHTDFIKTCDTPQF